ncbi:hypothetical protein HPB51_022860 [Rhipicephalus microplus]|uniref:Uncharacterized protein n=1 Tax=Rhipicephalus microplus TaxID=6941 RepID=A0A9J6DRA9_RHIMP|nr:hypothetical protein HPB51_022860 [Rhipicephalus microplus]
MTATTTNIFCLSWKKDERKGREVAAKRQKRQADSELMAKEAMAQRQRRQPDATLEARAWEAETYGEHAAIDLFDGTVVMTGYMAPNFYRDDDVAPLETPTRHAPSQCSSVSVMGSLFPGSLEETTSLVNGSATSRRLRENGEENDGACRGSINSTWSDKQYNGDIVKAQKLTRSNLCGGGSEKCGCPFTWRQVFCHSQ